MFKKSLFIKMNLWKIYEFYEKIINILYQFDCYSITLFYYH